MWDCMTPGNFPISSGTGPDELSAERNKVVAEAAALERKKSSAAWRSASSATPIESSNGRILLRTFATTLDSSCPSTRTGSKISKRDDQEVSQSGMWRGVQGCRMAWWHLPLRPGMGN